MGINMKLSQSDQRLYCPDRDIAHCGAKLMAYAIKGLDPDNQEQWVKDFLARENVTTDDLCKAAEVLANYVNLSMLKPENDSPLTALTEVGFFELNPALRVIVLAKVGQVFISTLYTCVRDITLEPSDPPFSQKMIVNAAEEIIKKCKSC